MFLAKLLFALSGLVVLAVAADDLKNCYCGFPTKIGRSSDPPTIEAVCPTYGTVKKDSKGSTACGILIDFNEGLFLKACNTQTPDDIENWCS